MLDLLFLFFVFWLQLHVRTLPCNTTTTFTATELGLPPLSTCEVHASLRLDTMIRPTHIVAMCRW